MAKQLVQAVETQPWSSSLTKNAALVVGATLLMGILGRFAMPLPFTPVPLTLANFGVLLVGLTLGSRRGFAALTLYLAAGAMGAPVFAPSALSGIAQLLGPTGGYLISYPFVAFLAGWIAEGGPKTFTRYAAGFSRRRNLALCERCLLDHGPIACSPGPGCKFRTIPIHLCRSNQGFGGRGTRPSRQEFATICEFVSLICTTTLSEVVPAS